jgi:epoxyqueuosine reductase
MDLSQAIKVEATRLGFSAFGIAKASYDPLSHNRFVRWLDKGYHSDMKYLERGPRERFDPKLHLPSAKSIIICAQDYYNEPNNDNSKPYISIYARGENYHAVITEKLEALRSSIQELSPKAICKLSVDSLPFGEKTFAVHAGLGFIGRNGLLILSPNDNGNQARGSFHFLGAIITNLELDGNAPNIGNCGQCRRCLDACPTGAIMEDGLIDTSRCISYHTTQNKGDIPPEIAKAMDNIIFGCDLCQVICPHNANVAETSESRLKPNRQTQVSEAQEIIQLDEDSFRIRFKGSSLGEKKFPIFKRNIGIAAKNIGSQSPPKPS